MHTYIIFSGYIANISFLFLIVVVVYTEIMKYFRGRKEKKEAPKEAEKPEIKATRTSNIVVHDALRPRNVQLN